MLSTSGALRRAAPVALALASPAAALGAESPPPPPAPASGAESPLPAPAVNEPFATSFVPSAQGLAYFPLGEGVGPFYGGGVEVVLFTWSNNADTFGPSQGKIRLDVGGLASARDEQGAMVLYRGGAVVSFERNANRSWLIPYFAADAGALHARGLGGRVFADASLGLYLLYTRNVMIDAEGSFVFPLTAFDRLAGPKATLTASFSLW
ncbi:MAG TPA: hypothetical protein VFS43_47125 [Polyangiaceae bacterium]|nr:hypothetical protein [Polyangiaceae bacterium]